MAAVKKAEALMKASVADGDKDYNEKLNDGVKIPARLVQLEKAEDDSGEIAPVELGGKESVFLLHMAFSPLAL